MASKSKTIYVCSECGYESSKWYGSCPGCGEWNTMQEDVRVPATAKNSKVSSLYLLVSFKEAQKISQTAQLSIFGTKHLPSSKKTS